VVEAVVAEAQARYMIANPKVPVLGLEVFAGSMEDLARVLRHMIRSGRLHHLVTLNPEIYMRTRHDTPFRQAVLEADLLLPDGIGIVWAGRLLGSSVAERLAGVDTVEMLCDICAHEQASIYLLGAGEGVARRAASTLERRHPGLRVAGAETGDPDPACDESTLLKIQGSRADVLLVAFGAPNQELWIWRNKAKLTVKIAMGVGGTFDFLAGLVPRAPMSWQRLGLEWLWRLLHQPWRWRRMLALPHFAALVLVAAALRRFN
jgi:N-acetylglucosaminyldiphosphoundecaprenol N-acetyl-beta-D-mannosaminyltransferase